MTERKPGIRSVPISVRITERQAERLDRVAEARDHTRASYLHDIVKRTVEEDERQLQGGQKRVHLT